MRLAILTFAVIIPGLACANAPGPFCLSGVTTYVEGAKGITKDRSLYGDGTDRGSAHPRGAEVRLGVALEWDPNRGACEVKRGRP